jgi:uncharacterized iron-regulated protein
VPRPSTRVLATWLLSAAALAGCSRPGVSLDARAGAGPVAAAAEPQAEAPRGRPAVPADAVARAAGRFVGRRVGSGELLSPEGLLGALSEADLICVGETHGDARSHYLELGVLAALLEAAEMTGRQVGVGLEMVSRERQPALDGYSTFELDERELLTEVRWDTSWGWDFAYYRPQLELARHRGTPLVALNAPKALTRSVARGGVDALSEAQRKQLPELDVSNQGHRRWFQRAMRKHPHGHPEHLYAAQVVWDETMADGAARWLGGQLPGRQLIVFAGAGHCRNDGIPGRVLRRLPARVTSIRVAKADEQVAADEVDFLALFDDE